MVRPARWGVTLAWVGLCVGVALWTVPWGDWHLLGRWGGKLSLAVLGAVSVPLVSIMVHELSHAVVAAATGHRIQGLYSWFPFGRIEFRVAGTWVVMGRQVRGGMCHLLSRDSDTAPSAWVYAAGGIGNFILGVAFLAVWLGPAKGFLAESWSLASAAYNFLSVVITFWPAQAQVVHASMPTDGQALYRRWTSAGRDRFEETTSAYAMDRVILGRPREAELHFRRVLARNPENGYAKYGLAGALYEQRRLAESRRLWHEFEGGTDLKRSIDAKASLALVKAMDQGDLELADRYSREALEASPGNPSYRHIRGFVLHVRGMREEGRQVLEQAYDRHVMPFARSGCALLLAWAAVDRGERAEAKRWLARSRRLDAKGWLSEELFIRVEMLARSDGTGVSDAPR